MRCTNCGWDNPSDQQICGKCKSPLKSTKEPVKIVTPPQQSHPVGGTLKGAESDFPYLDIPAGVPLIQKSLVNESAGSPCPVCGYPLRPDTAICPQCRKPVTIEESNPASAGGEADRKKEPGNSPSGGTVDPYNQVKFGCICLKPLPGQEEDAFPEIEFTGSNIVLNRSNLDPGNRSITSREQAVLQNVEGKWILSDKSPLQTTFIRVVRPVELIPGDIILLGDRKFEVNF